MLINRAQSLTEYSICLAVILIAVITINVYVKRGLQGRYKDLTDYTTTAALAPKEYEPYYKESNYTNTMGDAGRQSKANMSVGGTLRRDLPVSINMTVAGTSAEDALKVKE